MAIRKATAAETQYILKQASEVMQEATMGLVKQNPEAAQDMIVQALMHGGYYLVYEEQGSIKGWLAVSSRYDMYADEMAGLLLELYVLPAYRNRGIAEELMNHALRQLRKEGFSRVHLNVFTGNPARLLYEKLGFHDVSLMMEKQLR